MKKIVPIFFITALITLFSLLSCDDKKNETDNEKISLEVAAMQVQFAAVGIGNITFDWGDETKPETFVLSSVKSNFSHQYHSGGKHTIQINGHITSFYSGSFYIDGSYATNQISTLDVSKNSTLKELDCSENIITQMDVSQCTALTKLECWSNQLTMLNLNDNTALIKLRCMQNKLTNLEVSNNKMLTMIVCSENRITKLDMTNNVKLQALYCDKNNLSYLELNKLFETLHDDNITVKGKIVLIAGNPGSKYCNAAIAKNKGWDVQ